MQMKIHIRTIALAIAIGFPALGPMFAQEASQTTASGSDREANAQLIDKGKSLYAHYCSRCHGPNMVTPGTAVYDLRQFPMSRKADLYNRSRAAKMIVCPRGEMCSAKMILKAFGPT
jgi:mono/diheme cytochrome c family protein